MITTLKPSDAGMDEAALARLDASVQADIDAGLHFGASTGWLIDTDRDLTFIFLSAGFIEGLAHPQRLLRLCDLAIAAVRD
jgi:hypothetical protein